MRLDFVRNARRNVAAHVALNVAKTVLPFVNRTLLLWFMGVEYLGLNGLFASVLSVLSLAELGFGEAVESSLYKPVAEDDRTLVRAYLRTYRGIYRLIGSAVFLGGLLLVPFLPALVRGDVPADVDLRVLYLVHLACTASTYFVYAYRGPILGAHQRTDVAANIRTALLLLQYAVVIPIVVFVRNYYLYVAATAFFTVAANVLVVVAAKRLFPWAEPGGTLPDERRRKLFSDVRSILLNKVGGILSFQSNALVVSAFLGLGAVAVYGNYHYVMAAVAGFAGAMHGATAGGFGNRLHVEDRESNFALLLKASRLAMVAVAWASAMMLALYQPFMRIWTKGDPALVRHFATPLLMVLWFAVRQSRTILLSFKTGAAMWREDRWKAVAGGVADLAMNLAFVLCLPEGWKWFDRGKMFRYLRQQAAMAAFAAALCAATLGAVSLVPGGGALGLLAKGAVAASVSGAVVLALFGRELAAAILGTGDRNGERTR